HLPPSSTLVPYTTLFRSHIGDRPRTRERTMSGFDDITRKAQEFLNDDKVKDALKSEQAEDISDKLLDGAEDAVNKITGGKFEGQDRKSTRLNSSHVKISY